jgi:hypothetical protein
MNLDTRLQTAVGNGAGLALSPQEVQIVAQWKHEAEQRNGKKMPLWSPASPRERTKEILSGVSGEENERER